MVESVRVSRQKGIYHLFTFLWLACIGITVASLFFNYCTYEFMGMKADSESLFKTFKETFEIIFKADNSKYLTEFLKVYKWFLIGVGLLIVATLFRPGAKLSARVSEGGIKTCIVIDVIGLIIGAVGVYLTAPVKLLEPLLGDAASQLDITLGIGALMRFGAILAPVLGLVEDFLLLKDVGPTRAAVERALEEKRQEEIRREHERNQAAQQTVVYAGSAPASAPTQSLESKLEELISLKEKGLLTEEEYQQKRAKIIESF